MAWQTPKTDWVITDRFSYTHYNRIVGNLNYLKELINKLYIKQNLEDLESKTVTSIPYAEDYNAIEQTLKTLNLASLGLDFESKTNYRANGKTLTYEDYNRIETACLNLYEKLQNSYDNLPRLSITL